MPVSYPYPRPAVTCDVVVFAMRADDLGVLLISRKDEPFKGRWALPGGYVNENESLGRAAQRELAEETGITGAKLEQLGAFGDPGRDPRGHTITVAYLTFLFTEAKITAGDDAAAAKWHPLRHLALTEPALAQADAPRGPSASSAAAARRGPTSRRAARPLPLAFDHAMIVALAYRRLCHYLDDPLRPRGFELLPARFTLADLHHFYEAVLGRSLPKRSFQRRLFDQNLVVVAGTKPTRKPADQLYRWNRLR